MSHPISIFDDIDPEAIDALKSNGIRTTERLLEAAKSPKSRRLLAEKTQLNEKKLLRWATIADKLRIKVEHARKLPPKITY